MRPARPRARANPLIASLRPVRLQQAALRATPQQSRSRDTRERLKTAALTLFRRKGYANTSIGDIAVAAHVATGGVYIYFRSKRQLLLELMDDLVERLVDLKLVIDTTKPVRLALQDFLSAAFAGDLRFLGAYRAWQEASLTDRELAAKDRQIREWTTARVTQFLTMLGSLPGARQGVDLEALALAIDALLWSLVAQAAAGRKAELTRWVDSATHLIHHAMFRD